MVSGLDSRLSDLGLSLGQGTALCSWVRHFTFTVPRSYRIYSIKRHGVY